MNKRPSCLDTDIQIEAARQLASKLSVDDMDPESMASDLAAALEHTAPLFDGYDIMRYLDRDCGWSGDASLTSDLDDAGIYINSAERDAVKAWVRDNAIAPRLEVGAPVRFKSPASKGQEVDGVIANINAESGEYVVRVPSLGHVEHGAGTHGFVLPFEMFHDVVAPPEDFQLQAS